MKPAESENEESLVRLLRAAFPPPPAVADPARVEDDYYEALAASDAAGGVPPPPDIADRLAEIARRAAATRSVRETRRAAVVRRAAAAAAVVVLAGLAGAAAVALVAATGDGEEPATPNAVPAASGGRQAAVDIRTAPGLSAPAPGNPTMAVAAESLPEAEPADPISEAANPGEPDEPDARRKPSDVRHDEEPLFALYRPSDARTLLVAWQESLLPLSSAVTQEVGAVAICPDDADSAAWFATLWPEENSAPAAFPALLLDNLGDAVLTNLDSAAAAAVEALEDYDSAWILDETLPGIPEEHRRALMPFYDPALVVLSFDAVPDASRFVELAESGSPPIDQRSSIVTRHPSLVVSATNAVSRLREAHPSLEPQAHPSLAPQAPSSLAPQAPSSLAAEPPPPPAPDFKTIQRLLYRELLVPFYAGPDGSTHLSRQGAREIWEFALELGRGRLALVPNREWGGAYDLVVRSGIDDPFLRFCASLGSWKWGWADKARELRDDLSFRLAGGDAAPFQSLLLAHLDQRLEPSPDRAAALRAAFDAWAATLAGEFDRDDVRAWFGHWLVEDVVAAGPAPVRGGNPCADIRADAIARHAAEPAPDASPAPGTVPVHEDFVQATFLPLVLREVVAPLEAIEGDRDAPWRPMALAALRDWCLWTVRGEDRPDPLYMGRAVSAAGRGCPWPAIRFLAALKDYDDAAWDPETAIYGRPDPAALAVAARRVVEALVAADADPAPTPLARLLMHRAAAARRNPAVQGLSAQALSAAYLHAVAAAQSWPPAEIRALWILAPDTADWPAIVAEASDPWLRQMALGRAALAQSEAAQSTTAQRGVARAPLAQEAFARAASLRPAFPEPWIELLRHCAGDSAEARPFYDEAVRREFDAPGAVDAMLDALRPASLAGADPSVPASAEALLAFGDECLASGRFDTRVPFAWARSRFIAASLSGADWESPFRGEDAITNMNRVCDARLAHSRSSKDDRADAFYARLWPFYANNDFYAFVPACVAFGSCEGGEHGFTADFDPGHPMRRRALALAFGYAGYHHDDIVAAMHAWRVDGDLSAARDILRARAGRVSAATNAVDNWEQSYVSGRLAVLDCALARPGETYSLLPKAGTPGPRKFWRSREETVQWYHENGSNPEARIWWTEDRAGQMASSEPVVPASAELSFAIGLGMPNPEPSRFWIVPDDTPAFRPRPARVQGLLVERNSHGCDAGWAELDLFGVDDAPAPGAAGPRINLPGAAIDPDGTIRIKLRILDGTISVVAGDEPLPALDRPALVSADKPHAVAFAGHCFKLLRADISVIQDSSPFPILQTTDETTPVNNQNTAH